MSKFNENMNNQLEQIFRIFRYRDYNFINYVISNETKFDINMIYAN